MSLAKITDAGYAEDMDPAPTEDNPTRTVQGPTIPSTAVLYPPAVSGDALPPLSVVLSIPRGVRAEIRITGKDVRRDDLERLKTQIDFLMASFDDDTD
jgi:hypothetical protein